MEIERYAGDTIVLRHTEDFEKLKIDLDSQKSYKDKLLFWQSISIFQQKIEQGSLYTIITCDEYYTKSHSPAEGEYISIDPSENDLKDFILWAISIPDPLIKTEIENFERFDNKTILLEQRIKELEALLKNNDFFRETYRAIVQDKLTDLIDAFRATPKVERQLSFFVLAVRKANRWKGFLAVADPTNTHYTLLGGEDIGQNMMGDSGLRWKKDKNSLILLVQLLIETGYMEAPSFKEACEQFSLFLHIDLRNIYDAKHKMYERTKEGYMNGLIKDMIDYEKELRKSHGLLTRKK